MGVRWASPLEEATGVGCVWIGRRMATLARNGTRRRSQATLPFVRSAVAPAPDGDVQPEAASPTAHELRDHRDTGVALRPFATRFKNLI